MTVTMPVPSRSCPTEVRVVYGIMDMIIPHSVDRACWCVEKCRTLILRTGRPRDSSYFYDSIFDGRERCSTSERSLYGPCASLGNARVVTHGHAILHAIHNIDLLLVSQEIEGKNMLIIIINSSSQSITSFLKFFMFCLQ